mmetsp:Transcript_37510/g.37059  ORF Transcript_37510/g.37059 Transcript_37510/m.37059 type:complete len:148 (-) Transcript_37510:16-459(-)
MMIHDKNIIHRDISPHNIIFQEKGNIRSIKLINFENALFVGDSEQIEAHCNSVLRDYAESYFLQMREKLLNNMKIHLKSGKNFDDILEDNVAFIAPERANLQPYDKRVDYYALGVIFSMMLGNRHPYFHLVSSNSFDKFVQNINYSK